MKNPLLQHKFSTPHDTFPFADITVADIEAALLKGIEIERGEVDAIARSADEPSFRNTIVALSYAGEMLERATTLMYNQLSANTSDELEQLAEKMSPILSEHSASITLNESLFRRVRAVYEEEKRKPTLTGEDAMLLQDTYDSFVRSGAALPEEKRGRFKEVKAELAQLSLQFSQNNIKETNDFVLHLTQREDLAGLPDSQIEQAAAAAAERQLEGWVFTLCRKSCTERAHVSCLHDPLCARQCAQQL